MGGYAFQVGWKGTWKGEPPSQGLLSCRCGRGLFYFSDFSGRRGWHSRRALLATRVVNMAGSIFKTNFSHAGNFGPTFRDSVEPYQPQLPMVDTGHERLANGYPCTLTQFFAESPFGGTPPVFAHLSGLAKQRNHTCYLPLN